MKGLDIFHLVKRRQRGEIFVFKYWRRYHGKESCGSGLLQSKEIAAKIEQTREAELGSGSEMICIHSGCSSLD